MEDLRGYGICLGHGRLLGRNIRREISEHERIGSELIEHLEDSAEFDSEFHDKADPFSDTLKIIRFVPRRLSNSKLYST